MAAPPLEPDHRTYGRCVCGNSLPEPNLSIHRRTCGPAQREEDDMAKNTNAGANQGRMSGTGTTPEPTTQAATNAAIARAARGNWNDGDHSDHA